VTCIGDANDPQTVLRDARAFLRDFGHFWGTAEEDATRVRQEFDTSHANKRLPNYWIFGRLTSGLAQVYDLVAPLAAYEQPDLPYPVTVAQECMDRLRSTTNALLEQRDDKSNRPEDRSRCRVMKAWGGYTEDRDGEWNTDVVTSGLFVYAMAAFARRVAERPEKHSIYQADARKFIVAALETFDDFRRDELHFRDDDPHAYFTFPSGYSQLRCLTGSSDTIRHCKNFRGLAGQALAFNESLSMMKALADLAVACDSAWFRGTAEATPERLRVATVEAPLIIAKGVAFFCDHLSLDEPLPDGTPWFRWPYRVGEDTIENTPHGQFGLGCMAVILENKIALEALLARANRTERLPTPSFFAPAVNNFLRKIWHDNSLTFKVDGSEADKPRNNESAGFVAFSQLDPRVWKRSRDTACRDNAKYLEEDNHAALLRYRQFSTMKHLTDFAGQNWLITPAATAVGEPAPDSIHDQKWLLVLSGIVVADLKGDSSGAWNHETVSFVPDMAGPDAPGATSGPLNWAISRYRIPKPAGTQGMQYLIRFSVDAWSPFVSLSAIFNQEQSNNGGFAVNTWRPNPFGSGTNALTNQPVSKLFNGVNADLAVRDTDAWVYRVGYHITLVGKIVFIAPAF